jgi:hypothetical protein
MFGGYNRLTIRCRNQEALEDVPDSKQGVATLIIKRRDREEAQAFCTDVGQYVARLRGQRIEDEFNRLAE